MAEAPNKPEKKIAYREHCEACSGTGQADPDCGECGGNGLVDDPDDGGTMVCPTCGDDPCEHCE